MNTQLKTRITILNGAIDKLAIFEVGTLQSHHVLVLQERLRSVVMEWKLECLEDKVKGL